MSSNLAERKRIEALSDEIRRLMIMVRTQIGEEESNKTAIVKLEQLTQELNNLCLPYPIQEEARDNSHHELHTSTECSSPSPEWNILEHYVIVDEHARHGSGGSAMLLAPPHNAEK